MTLPEAVAAYVDARATADSAPVWARLSSEDEAAHRMRELLAACFGASVALDDALIAHAPAFVQAQAERWQGMVDLLEPVKAWAPEPVIILGPRRPRKQGETYGPWVRLHLSTGVEGAIAHDDVWSLQNDKGVMIDTGRGDMDDAEEAAESRRWVLLDENPKEPEPIVVLGPWQASTGGSVARLSKGQGAAAMFVHGDGRWEAWSGGRYVNCGVGGRDSAEAWARKYGWVLLDAEPLANVTRLGRVTPLGPWQGDATFRTRRGPMPGTHPIVLVGLSGWSVLAHGSLFAERAAHGPQTGPEGERLAMAAAYALGFVEGAQ